MRTIKRVEKNNRIIICSLVFVPREICQPRTNTSFFCFDLSIADYIIDFNPRISQDEIQRRISALGLRSFCSKSASIHCIPIRLSILNPRKVRDLQSNLYIKGPEQSTFSRLQTLVSLRTLFVPVY
jgi:hypothetical protein